MSKEEVFLIDSEQNTDLENTITHDEDEVVTETSEESVLTESETPDETDSPDGNCPGEVSPCEEPGDDDSDTVEEVPEEEHSPSEETEETQEEDNNIDASVFHTDEKTEEIREMLLNKETTLNSFSKEQLEWLVKEFGDGKPLIPEERLHRWPFILVFSIIAVLSFILGCLTYSHRHFSPNTYINGYDVGTLSVAKADSILKEDALTGDVVIEWEDGKRETIPLESLHCTITTEPDISQFLSESTLYSWMPWNKTPKTYGVSLGYVPEEKNLRAAVNSLDCVVGNGTTEPENAKIVRKNGFYTVQPEQDGTRVDPNLLYPYIVNCLKNGEKEIPLKGSGTFVKAKVTKDNEKIKEIMEKAEVYEGIVITLDLNGISERIDWSVFGPWMSYKDGEFVLHRGEVEQYIDTLADKYDTFGKTRTFTSADGELKTVGGGEIDNYGFLMNRDSTAWDVGEAIVSKKSQTVKASWEQEGIAHGVQNDFGHTYIEVSIEKQHMWFFVNGKLTLETDVVTGMDVEERRRTPKGIYQVLDKIKDHTMTGSYGSAYCNYCIAISWEGICIHDSPWRDEYGGDIYIYSGSHGCINTPLGKMAELFDNENVTYGIPVIVY